MSNRIATGKYPFTTVRYFGVWLLLTAFLNAVLVPVLPVVSAKNSPKPGTTYITCDCPDADAGNFNGDQSSNAEEILDASFDDDFIHPVHCLLPVSLYLQLARFPPEHHFLVDEPLGQSSPPPKRRA